MPKPQRPYKRRIIIINKGFQYKFIAVIMVCVALAVAIIAVDMFTSLGLYVAEGTPSVDMAAIYEDTWVALLVKVLVYMGGVFLVALVVSHRVAGPLYRFEKAAEGVAKGDLVSKVFLRKGDEWGAYRESFNGMVDALREKVAADLDKARRVGKALEEAAAESGVPPAAAQKLRRAAEALTKLGDRFKLV